jgi:hypothetical protein
VQHGIAGGVSQTKVVYCDPNDRALSGDYGTNTPWDIRVLDDEFLSNANPRGYRFTVTNPTSQTHDFHLGVLCMNLP